jgi:hypothetical protein
MLMELIQPKFLLQQSHLAFCVARERNSFIRIDLGCHLTSENQIVQHTHIINIQNQFFYETGGVSPLPLQESRSLLMIKNC